jgi:hypothetical protein
MFARTLSKEAIAMQARQVAQDVLLPFTRLMLGVSALVQLIFGLLGLFLTNLWNTLIWTSPLPPWPSEVAHFTFINYLATAAAAAFALYQGR